MSETIKMSGRLLIFDKISKNEVVFPKDCELSYPEKVPVTWEFNTVDPGAVKGFAVVKKDERGLLCVVELTNFERDVLQKCFHDELPIGGYYQPVETHNENGLRVVDKATLRMIGITLEPADDELKMKVVEESHSAKTKPPLGVMPKDIWDRKRQKELAAAMKKYGIDSTENLSKAKEWLDNYNKSLAEAKKNTKTLANSGSGVLYSSDIQGFSTSGMAANISGMSLSGVKFAPTGDTNNSSIYIDRIELPNVSNANEFVEALKTLPTLATAQATSRKK